MITTKEAKERFDECIRLAREHIAMGHDTEINLNLARKYLNDARFWLQYKPRNASW